MKSASAARVLTTQQTAEKTPSTVPTDDYFNSAIPPEIVVRDAGCGNPAKFLKPGEHVLDLGSGAGKTTFVAAQIIGRTGRVMAIDHDPEKLRLSRQALQTFSKTVGYLNIEFRKGKAEDLRMNLEKIEKRLTEDRVFEHGQLEKFEEFVRAERMREPLIADNTFDAVMTNNVMTILSPIERERALKEIHRTLKSSGRAILCEIACSQAVPPTLKNNDDLRQASVSGALQESVWMNELEQVGFKKINVVERAPGPWRVINGIEFRAITILASTRPLEELVRLKP